MFLTCEVSPQRVRVYPRLGWRADVSPRQGRLFIVPRVNHCTSVTDGPRGILRDGKAIILPLQRPWQRVIYASACASLMSRGGLVPTNMAVPAVCGRNLWPSFVPNNRGRKQLRRERNGSSFMIYVMAPYWLLSLSNGSPRTPDFTRRAPSPLLRPPSRKQECDNEAEEAGKCISRGFSFLI